MIELNETILVPANPDEVWKVLSDPHQVVSCVADAEITQDNGDGTYDGRMTVKFGPMRVKFNARVELTLGPEAQSGQIVAQGKDGSGGTRMRTTASFDMQPTDRPNETRVQLSGDVELAGRLAGQLESVAGTVVKRMSSEFSEALAAKLAPEPPPVAAEAAASALSAPGHAAAPRRGFFSTVAAWFRRVLGLGGNSTSRP